MHLHKLIWELGGLAYDLKEPQAEEELYNLSDLLNKGETVEVIPDPCLLVKVKHGAQRTKLLETCTHSKIHQLIRHVKWVTLTILDQGDIESDFSKTLDFVWEELKKGEPLIIEPDQEWVEKCKRMEEEYKIIEAIFNEARNDIQNIQND